MVTIKIRNSDYLTQAVQLAAHFVLKLVDFFDCFHEPGRQTTLVPHDVDMVQNIPRQLVHGFFPTLQEPLRVNLRTNYPATY